MSFIIVIVIVIRHTCTYFCAYLALYVDHCHHDPSGIPVHTFVLTLHFTLVIAIMIHHAYLHILLCLPGTLRWSLPSWSIRHTCSYLCANLALYVGHCHHDPSGIPAHTSVIIWHFYVGHCHHDPSSIPAHTSVLTWHFTLVIAIMIHQAYLRILLCYGSNLIIPYLKGHQSGKRLCTNKRKY